MNEIRKLLTPAQQKVYDIAQTATKPIAWLGSIRAGKTYGGCGILTDQMTKNYGNYIIAAYSYGNIERNILPVLTDFKLKFNDIDSVFEADIKGTGPWKYTVYNGKGNPVSTAYTFSANNVESQKSLQGMTARGGLLDEVVLLPQNFVMQCVGRISVEPLFLLMTANKSAPNSWVKTQWVDKGKAIEINNVTADNPHITEKTMKWYDDLLVGHYKGSMLENEWVGEYNVVSGDPNYVDELTKWNSACEPFMASYITYGRKCNLIEGFVYQDQINIESITEMDAEEVFRAMNENNGNGDNDPCPRKIVSETPLGAGFGISEEKLELELWAQSLNRHSQKIITTINNREQLVDTAAWVYKDDQHVENISTEILSLALVAHVLGNRVEVFAPAEGDRT